MSKAKCGLEKNERPLIASFSGGRTSAFMARALQLRHQSSGRKLIFVFANTGKERKETLDFVNECDKRWGLGVVWVEFDLDDEKTTFKITDYENASRDGEPFEKCMFKYGLPNMPHPFCSSALKNETITRYLRSIGLKNGDYETAIGIRADEAHRINWETAKKRNNVYPLATDFKASKQFIRTWWDRQEFDLQLKDYEGNCDLCWKKSERKLLTIIKENPNLIDWWRRMEIKYGKSNFTFFRNGKSATDLIERSKHDFQMAVDEFEEKKQQTTLFDYEMDLEYDCFCKST